MTSFSFVDRMHVSEESAACIFRVESNIFCPEKWRQEVLPNRWYFYTKLNGVTSQNSVVTYRCKDIKSQHTSQMYVLWDTFTVDDILRFTCGNNYWNE